jgi:hypothetical protein
MGRLRAVAHGDIADIFRNLTDYDLVAEQEALDQLTKANRFLVEWFNTAPDVQEATSPIISGPRDNRGRHSGN